MLSIAGALPVAAMLEVEVDMELAVPEVADCSAVVEVAEDEDLIVEEV